MKICIAQIQSERGSIKKNIDNHFSFIERAINLKADLIIFPELSITNYEPDLAQDLAIHPSSYIFNPFKEASNKNGITICVGMPIKINYGTSISMVILRPNLEQIIYSKQMLHFDELGYFVPGKNQNFFSVKGVKIAVGICYETLQLEHFLHAFHQNIAIYIASVAKPKSGIEKAYKHYSTIASKYNTPILMSNCIGHCDNFISDGQSAIWNRNGKLLAQLDNSNQGILIYDCKTEEIEKEQLRIEKGSLSDIDELFKIYLNGKNKLEENGIFQWTDNYPTYSIIENDLRKKVLFVIKNGEKIMGAINISEEQEAEYKTIKWAFNNSKVLVIHRLIIEPKYQGKGYASNLMNFAEKFAKKHSYNSIRLDAYSQNKKVVNFYKNRKYSIRGNVNFLGRKHPFYCMEKEINT